MAKELAVGFDPTVHINLDTVVHVCSLGAAKAKRRAETGGAQKSGAQVAWRERRVATTKRPWQK